jgi:ABC-type lipoprotein release transport system permease subunit
MNPALIAFGFGVVVGVFGGILLMGLFFMFRERLQNETINELQTAQVAPKNGIGKSKTTYPQGYQEA